MRKLLRMGLVLAREWRGQAVGVAPRRRAEVGSSRQESVSSPLFMEETDLEDEEDLFIHHGHALLGGRRLDEQMAKRATEGGEETDL